MPYTVDSLIWLTYVHLMIFFVPAMGLGISLLREGSQRRRRKDVSIHRLVPGAPAERKTA